MRVQVAGKVKMLVVLPGKLGPVFGACLNTLMESLKSIDDELMGHAIKAGAVYEVTVEPYSALYIPAGCITFEHQAEGVLV